MILSHSKQFVFIHIYKNAGISIQLALKKWNSLEENIILKGLRKIAKLEVYGMGYMSRLKMTDRLKDSHTNLRDLEKYLPENLLQNYFKFAIVRNPWSWQVSLYEYAKLNTKHFQHQLHSNLSNFGDYILWRVENEPRLQTDFIVNSKGDFGLNYLGRFEDLDKDFEYCCHHLNISTSIAKKKCLCYQRLSGVLQ
ncbi:sulfotransferase family 2 domain-containing protein [Dapis sp. BLCC M229]|uniref:sulfotransferase family 2 domain-containing protein n=1 Tax=Dapis sp. BLCC M229 TaxID=3400188 RepID=UPI003CF82D91